MRTAHWGGMGSGRLYEVEGTRTVTGMKHRDPSVVSRLIHVVQGGIAMSSLHVKAKVQYAGYELVEGTNILWKRLLRTCESYVGKLWATWQKKAEHSRSAS